MAALTRPFRVASSGKGGTAPVVLTFKIHGIEHTQRNLTRALQRVRISTPLVLAHINNIVKRAAAPLTPVDTQDTLNSLYSQIVRISRNAYYGEVGYQTWYAPIIHENVAGVTWRRAGAESKFLEKAVLRNAAEISRALKEGVAKALYGAIR